VDYDWWERLTQQGVFFVTRFKADLRHEVVEERVVPQNRNIVADQVVRGAPFKWDSISANLLCPGSI
ncbi:MAG: hypothetical protein HYX25_05300, partial [Candidatus Solibacter usitatus]|nr:hypothetical protein [Candidatus Solibacter usitatus]